MTKTEAMRFFGALQLLMKRYQVDSMEVRDGRIVFFSPLGKSMCSFESLDLSSELMSDCVTEPAYRDLA